MGAETASLTATRQEKHIALDEAISKIEGVLNRVQSLVRRISGENSDPGPDSERKQPSLSEVLSTGPEQIMSKCNEIYSALDEVEKLLF